MAFCGRREKNFIYNASCAPHEILVDKNLFENSQRFNASVYNFKCQLNAAVSQK